MHNLSQRYRKMLSVGLSVISSVFLVAVVVSAATTIGSNINTGGTLDVTGLSTVGSATSTYLNAYKWFGAGGTATTTIDSSGNVSIAGTLGVTGLTTLGSATSTYLNAYKWLGVGGTATTTIDSSGNLAVVGTATMTGLTTMGSATSTYLSAYQWLGVGTTATTTINGASTSTFSSGVLINETAATSTFQVGRALLASGQGQGGCIAIGATSGTSSGINTLYLIVVPKPDGSGLELVTSTLARDCGY